jgi:hypothetical protein
MEDGKLRHTSFNELHGIVDIAAAKRKVCGGTRWLWTG